MMHLLAILFFIYSFSYAFADTYIDSEFIQYNLNIENDTYSIYYKLIPDDVNITINGIYDYWVVGSIQFLINSHDNGTFVVKIPNILISDDESNYNKIHISVDAEEVDFIEEDVHTNTEYRTFRVDVDPTTQVIEIISANSDNKESSNYFELKPSKLSNEELNHAQQIALSNSTLLEIINTQPFEFNDHNSFLGNPKTGKWNPLLYININNKTTASVLVNLEEAKVLKISTVDRLQIGVGLPLIDYGHDKHTPPLSQIKKGILIQNILCNKDLILIQKYDGSPACVTPETKSKLIERGWAKPT